MIIRKVLPEDIPACARILCSVYNNDLWQNRWSETTAAQYLSDIYRMPKFVGFVLETESCILGAVFAREKVWWSGSEVYVEELFIRPEYQGKGCGTRLMEEIGLYVREKNLAGITLSTNRYAPAVNFYHKHGFTDCEHVLFLSKEIEK